MGMLTRNGRRRLFQNRGLDKVPYEVVKMTGCSLAQAKALTKQLDQGTVDANTPKKGGFFNGGFLMALKNAFVFLGSEEGQKALSGFIKAISMIVAAFGGLAITAPPAPQKAKKTKK